MWNLTSIEIHVPLKTIRRVSITMLEKWANGTLTNEVLALLQFEPCFEQIFQSSFLKETRYSIF